MAVCCARSAVESRDEALLNRCAGAIANTAGNHIVEVAMAGGMCSLMAALVAADDSSTRAACARAVANLSLRVHDSALDAQVPPTRPACRALSAVPMEPSP